MTDNLIRQEVLDARKQQWLGSVHLPTSRLGIPMSIAAVAVVAMTVLLLTFGTYTRKERVQGQLVPSNGMVNVIAPTSGVLMRLLVDEGEFVDAGQPLVEISPDIDAPNSDFALGRVVEAELDRQRDRLLLDLESISAMEAQQQKALKRSIRSLSQQVGSAATETTIRIRQLENSTERLNRMRELHKKGFITDLALQQQEDLQLGTRAELELAQRRKLDLEDRLADAQGKLDELPLKMSVQRNEVDRELADIAQLIARNQTQQSVVVRAPSTGTVTGILADQHSSVLSQQRLLSLVPHYSSLYAELWAPSRAVGQIAPGTKVAMRYHSFPYQRYGHQQGEVIEVSRSALSPQEVQSRAGIDPGVPAYRVLVKLDEQFVDSAGDHFELRAEMTLDADLLLEKRNLYLLLLEPFDRSRAFSR